MSDRGWVQVQVFSKNHKVLGAHCMGGFFNPVIYVMDDNGVHVVLGLS